MLFDKHIYDTASLVQEHTVHRYHKGLGSSSSNLE